MSVGVTLLTFWVLTQCGGNVEIRTEVFSEERLNSFLKSDYEWNETRFCNNLAQAKWNFVTDLSNIEKGEALIEAVKEQAAYKKSQWNVFRNVSFSTIHRPEVKRQFLYLSNLGTAVLNETSLTELQTALNAMLGVYGSARICPYEHQSCNIETEGMRLTPDIEDAMATSRDLKEKEYVWKQWRDATGNNIKNNFIKFVNLNNQAAKFNGFKHAGEMWMAEYETQDLRAEIMKIWKEIKPFYDKLHSYTYYKLKNTYREEKFVSNFIPAHLLGDLWAENWINIYSLVEPFPKKIIRNVTSLLQQKSYDVPRMVQMANIFFTSLGFTNLTSSDLWILEQPPGRDLDCYPTAHDLCTNQEFRIKMCAEVTEKDFLSIHQLLAQVHYFKEYTEQPIDFRKEAIPGFAEAVARSMTLSISSPAHHRSLNLTDEGSIDDKITINILLRSALSQIPRLAHAMALDSWRWKVMSGAISQNQWNQRLWKLREEYEKVKAPEFRGEEYFDPGADYEIAANVPYASKIVSGVLQFQIHRALCLEAGHNSSFHLCDVSGSVLAGDKLRSALRLGRSVPWREALQSLTGSGSLSGGALLEFYAPLVLWLTREEEARRGEHVAEELAVPLVVGGMLLLVTLGVLGAILCGDGGRGSRSQEQAMRKI